MKSFLTPPAVPVHLAAQVLAAAAKDKYVLW